MTSIGDWYDPMTMTRWNNPNYQRVVAVQLQEDELRVAFADGDSVVLPLGRLAPPALAQRETTVAFSDYEVNLITPTESFAIPWSTFRLLSDQDFATHWANQAEKQAQQVGVRLKELRRQRNLSGKAVAARAGISPQSLSRIERGHHDVVFTTLQRILAAMGCTLQDLAEMETLSVTLQA